MTTGYYLLDAPKPHGEHFYADRLRPVLAVVVHVTASLQGAPTGADTSAERTALYAATTDRKVSWHSGSDRDSFLRLLPDTFTAWHARGYNSSTIGHEISKRDTSWADEDPVWVRRTLETAAACLRPRLAALGIPVRRASRRELDDAIERGGPPVGLIGHSELDPKRRTDPGRDFPWSRFLSLLKPPPPPGPALPMEDEMLAIVTAPDAAGRSVHYLTNFMTKRRIRPGGEEGRLRELGVKPTPYPADAVLAIPDQPGD